MLKTNYINDGRAFFNTSKEQKELDNKIEKAVDEYYEFKKVPEKDRTDNRQQIKIICLLSLLEDLGTTDKDLDRILERINQITLRVKIDCLENLILTNKKGDK